jgi:hypothetical protein
MVAAKGGKYSARKIILVYTAVAAVFGLTCAGSSSIDEGGTCTVTACTKTGRSLSSGERRRDKGKKDCFELSN